MNNGIEKITDRIIAEANEEAKKNIDEATLKADQSISESKEKAERILERYKQEGEKEATICASNALSSAEFKERNSLLLAKVSLINEAFDIAFKKLSEMDKETYFDYLKNQLNKALDSAKKDKESHIKYGDEYDSNEEYVLFLNQKDREAFAARLCENTDFSIKVSDSTCDIAGGFILKCGNTELNCSLELTMQRLRKSLEKEVAKILFG